MSAERPAPAAGITGSRALEAEVTRWFAVSARDLPWRRPGATAWEVLVSEFMLQQTPVPRVLPAYRAWLGRWPTARALAAATPGDAVRQWGALGYPRRAIRLHACAVIISARHGGRVPASLEALREMPGVGDYTAAAVTSFAFGQRHAVLDTNVRRVLARLVGGRQFPAGSVSAGERALAESLLPPAAGRRAATWSAALMELGALICTPARPACDRCPVAHRCAWRAAGMPPGPPPRRGAPYQGSDRQCRGSLLAVLRSADGPVAPAALAAAWPDPAQRDRALGALLFDGMAVRRDDGLICLPGDGRPPPPPGGPGRPGA